jgi:p-aminobenzoyl-glutamate transporter AbgT
MSDATASGGSGADGSKKGGLLDAVEWIGNKLPDPAVLFLMGAVLVVLASHLAAPSLPEGFEVRWSDVGNRAGGVDEHLGVIGRVGVAEDGSETFTPGSFVVDESGETLAAHLVLDGDEVVTGEDGEPIDFAERGWAVFQKRPAEAVNPETGEPELVLRPTGDVMFARSLMTSEGLYWVLSSMEANFLGFAPLGVVLLGMLGIGPMERVGLIGALLRLSLKQVPPALLTPAMVFLGIMSSVGSDAGYVVLPPLAAAAYVAVGRSPLAGIAAVFAGVAAGFNANLVITSLEPLMAELTQSAAQQVDAARQVAATSSWYFMAASTIVITFAGWATTAVFVEKRLSRKPAEDGGPDPEAAKSMADMGNLTAAEKKGLVLAMGTMGLALALIVTLVFWEGSPLAGLDGIFPRWVAVIVPLMFLGTIVPAMVYGTVTGVVKDSKDAARTMVESMANMAPIIVLAFFAGQFVAYFGESNIGAMLAFSGGVAVRAEPARDHAGAGVHRGDDGVQHVRRIDVRQVRAVRADLRADVHADRDPPRADDGRVPDRRLGDEHHHAAQRLPRDRAGVHAEVRAEGGHGHAGGHDAPLHGRLRDRVVADARCVGVARDPARARRSGRAVRRLGSTGRRRRVYSTSRLRCDMIN